ncbi:hypothetical protein [Pseudorhodobacter sp. MZDSW-24AT]|uniref:hypothetical protein n=1 Tax=Pseudorhodobacter sp. MZDSW-24AT TaxID=2052957 RepID=UPI0012FD3DBB|nr:hypothetical protein [Pseudorhodobacter sp. MZDSW-24AT]
MRRWQEDLSKHPINTTLQQLEEAARADIDEIDTVINSERERFLKVVLLMRRVITDLDPDLAPIDILDQLQSQLTSHGVMNSMNSFIQTKEGGHIRNANNQLAPALSYIYQLSSLKFSRSTKRADIDAASVSFSNFSKNLDAATQEYMTYASNSLEAITLSLKESKQISERVKSSEEEFRKELTVLKNQATEISNSQKAEFSSAQAKRLTDFAEALSAIKLDAEVSLKEIFDQQEAEASAKQQRTRNALDEIIVDAEDKQEKILKLYSLVAHDSVTGGHKNIADREYSAAQWWRRGTIFCICITTAWLICSLVYLQPVLEPERLFWTQIAKGIALTALLISFAVYASKQANLHRINERKARAFFLQVQAFDPFIENLPDDKRWEMKQALSARIFGSEDSTIERKLVDDADFKGVEQVIGLFERLKKAAGK